MSIEAIELNTIDDLYAFVESAIQRTGLILIPDALYRPWVRTVTAECRDVHWLHLNNPLSEALSQHLANFAHVPLPEKGFVLFQMGRVVKVIDIDTVNGSSRPDRLSSIVKEAFTAKPKSRSASAGASAKIGSEDPYRVLGASDADSDEEIKRKYKQMMMQYHPDRVAHLGSELKELAAKKTTEINTAFAALKKRRGF